MSEKRVEFRVKMLYWDYRPAINFNNFCISEPYNHPNVIVKHNTGDFTLEFKLYLEIIVKTL